VILEFFQRNPEIGLLFICENSDGYGRHRKITFNKWYKEANAPIEKFDCREAYTKEGFYTSILVLSDNPMKDYYVDAFYGTIDEFFPDNNQSLTSDVALFQ